MTWAQDQEAVLDWSTMLIFWYTLRTFNMAVMKNEQMGVLTHCHTFLGKKNLYLFLVLAILTWKNTTDFCGTRFQSQYIQLSITSRHLIARLLCTVLMRLHHFIMDVHSVHAWMYIIYRSWLYHQTRNTACGTCTKPQRHDKVWLYMCKQSRAVGFFYLMEE